MTGKECEGVRELLPELVLDTLSPKEGDRIREHLHGCAECRQEMDIVGAIHASRPEPPAGLEQAIRDRVRKEMGVPNQRRDRGVVIPFRQRTFRVPTWGLSAAAVLVLSLGIGVVWNGEEPPEMDEDPIQVVAGEPLPESWLWDDGVVAGAPVYDGLSEEQLQALIEELEG